MGDDRLRKEWERKLRASGFHDIETETPSGPARIVGDRGSASRRARNVCVDAQGYCDAIEREALQALRNREPWHTFAALLYHSQGHSMRATARALGTYRRKVRRALEPRIDAIRHELKSDPHAGVLL